MSKYSRKNKVSEKTKEESIKVARATQRPGQTKEQTKLIARGIQKGIDQYKKQHGAKKRELDKKLKKSTADKAAKVPINKMPDHVAVRNTILPWVLLIMSWFGFAAYLVLIKS